LDITTLPKICIISTNKNQKINNEKEINNETKFWKSFLQSIEKNKRGLDGKQRILSIIVEEFGPKILHEKLQVIFYFKNLFNKFKYCTY
jgi:hypothetical protein